MSNQEQEQPRGKRRPSGIVQTRAVNDRGQPAPSAAATRFPAFRLRLIPIAGSSSSGSKLRYFTQSYKGFPLSTV